MPEADTISGTQLPLTVDLLVEQFGQCGLQTGQTVLVHSSLSKLGWVAGGAQAVVQALIQVLGESGTLMMPSFTTQNTNPENWKHPPQPADWIAIIQANMPAFDAATSPPRNMGAIADLFRIWPGTVRSHHPVGSFSARGVHADYLTNNHQLLDEFGITSPLARLYELDGYILLLGVGHGNDSSLHLAEHRATWPSKHSVVEGSAVLVDGVREWVRFDMLDLDTSDFVTIGEAYEKQAGLIRGRVGQAEVRFMKQRPLIDFAVEWMEANRK
ncbi:MAG: aminoglycoside N(3)-acetyltransferase [Anaerolineaceae bacterium]|nr:aminoglycoside N(3)-acetyltransferase [Anaerolineaceae bacterium]